MTAHLDTSAVVRYLSGDPRELHEASVALMRSGERFVMSDLVLLEAAYSLTTHYRFDRVDVVDALVAFVQHEAIELDGVDVETAVEALLMCRPSGRVSFGDALIWARAVSRGDAEVVTADRRFPGERVRLRRLEPSAP